MRALLLLVLLSTLLVVPVSADNVTVEIFETTDAFYIEYNGGELIECPDAVCTFNVVNYTENVTVSEFGLSNNDMTKLVKKLALELNFGEINTCINESFLIKALDDEGEDIGDRVTSHNLETMAPTIEDFDLVEQEKIQLESEVAELQVKGKLYDDQQVKDNEVIEIYKKQAHDATFVAMLCIIGFVAIVVTCTPAGRGFLDSLDNRFFKKG